MIFDLEIPLPPLAEQKRIVALLDEAFAGIDEAKAKAEAIRTNAKELKASLLSRQLIPDEASMKADWKTVKLGERFKIRSSKRVLQSEWKTEGVPFYRGREVTILSKSGVVDNALFISEGHFKELSAKYGVPAAGDIILTAIGTIGNAYVVKPNDRFYFKDASVLWITACAEYDSNFVNYWIKSDHFKGQLDSGNGATVDTLTLDKLKSIEIPLPPLAEQKRIVALLDEAFAGIEHLDLNISNEIAAYSDLKSSLLTQAFAGELTA